MVSNLVKEQLRHLPDSPGVYLMKDASGNIIYVGKAADLRQRVRSYFTSSLKQTPKIERLAAEVNDLDFFLTGSELEALILEDNLIKRFRPYYNVRLKDDKSFPYLKISLNEDWPRIYITRLVEDDGSRYFGPYASPRSVRQTIKVLKYLFPLRPCSREITGNEKKPCLEYHIHHCAGPCIGAVSKQEYASIIKQLILFLEGRHEKVVRNLKKEMAKASEQQHFERAARLRDQIRAIENVVESQRIAMRVRGDQDIIAFVTERDRSYVQVFFVRNGKLIGRESFVLQGTNSTAPEEIMTSFVKQFYSSVTYIPPLLVLQYPIEDETTIAAWLEKKRGSKVTLLVPQRGEKKKLVDLVFENARQGLQQLRIKQQAVPSATAAALVELKKELQLPSLPKRIECYDISDIQGTAAVGSMVVFEEGKAKPAHYRRFRIKTVAGANDYAMLQEVLQRRFKRSTVSSGDKDAWVVLPDLVLIDGGRGQLNAAIEVMREAGFDSIPVAGLAKENEEIFLPQKPEPIVLPGSSPALQLLQRARDEAHRFALGYHMKVRRKASFSSALDTIPGIGPARRRALLRKFGSLQEIRRASVEELAATKGMNPKLAQKVKETL